MNNLKRLQTPPPPPPPTKGLGTHCPPWWSFKTPRSPQGSPNPPRPDLTHRETGRAGLRHPTSLTSLDPASKSPLGRGWGLPHASQRPSPISWDHGDTAPHPPQPLALPTAQQGSLRLWAGGQACRDCPQNPERSLLQVTAPEGRLRPQLWLLLTPPPQAAEGLDPHSPSGAGREGTGWPQWGGGSCPAHGPPRREPPFQP